MGIELKRVRADEGRYVSGAFFTHVPTRMTQREKSSSGARAKITRANTRADVTALMRTGRRATTFSRTSVYHWATNGYQMIRQTPKKVFRVVFSLAGAGLPIIRNSGYFRVTSVTHLGTESVGRVQVRSRES